MAVAKTSTFRRLTPIPSALAADAPRVAEVPARAMSAFTGPAADWADVPALFVDHFRPEGSSHRPATRVRIVHHGDALRIRFDVADRYVLARDTPRQGPVHQDSCVEAFLRPRPGGPYFNFEFSCSGVVHCRCIDDPRRVDGVFARATLLPDALLDRLTITTTFTGPVWPELAGPVDWHLEVLVPLAVMEPYVGPLGDLAGQAFGANFYKCADGSSHPHWASWSPIGAALNFHVPEHFGTLHFG